MIKSYPWSGKCSHGGFFDRTSRKDPVGGINKDTHDSSHGLSHFEAADLAIRATMELLEDIRLAAGGKNFMRYKLAISDLFWRFTQEESNVGYMELKHRTEYWVMLQCLLLFSDLIINLDIISLAILIHTLFWYWVWSHFAFRTALIFHCTNSES